MEHDSYLRALRIGKGMTIRSLSHKLDLSPPYISELETGKAFPSCTTLVHIADFYGVDSETLMEHMLKDMPFSKEKLSAIAKFANSYDIETLCMMYNRGIERKWYHDTLPF